MLCRWLISNSPKFPRANASLFSPNTLLTTFALSLVFGLVDVNSNVSVCCTGSFFVLLSVFGVLGSLLIDNFIARSTYFLSEIIALFSKL